MLEKAKKTFEFQVKLLSRVEFEFKGQTQKNLTKKTRLKNPKYLKKISFGISSQVMHWLTLLQATYEVIQLSTSIQIAKFEPAGFKPTTPRKLFS